MLRKGEVRFRHARDHPDLDQIDMGMALERSRNIPLFFEILWGSIPYIVTLKKTVESIRKLIPKIEIIPGMGIFLV